jgi:small subunit ribosomal protein S20
MATGQKAKKKIVRLASGRKRARQSIKENAANSSLRSKLRTAIKAVRKAVAAGDKKLATDTFKASQSIIDIIADKKIVHKNKASRDKSRLSAAVKAMA